MEEVLYRKIHGYKKSSSAAIFVPRKYANRNAKVIVISEK